MEPINELTSEENQTNKQQIELNKQTFKNVSMLCVCRILVVSLFFKGITYVRAEYCIKT